MSDRNVTISRLVVFAIAAGGIFLLPWYLPPTEPTESLSYTYGFNNQVAWVFVIAAIGALSFLEILRRPFQRSQIADCVSELLNPVIPDGRNSGLRKAMFVTIVVSIGAALAWYLILPHSDFGEMSYFVSRLELMILGHHPYSGFDFLYGPLLIYPQFWLYRLGSGLLSVEQAYGAILVLHVAIGIFLLYSLFMRLGGRGELTFPFLCIFVPSFVGMFGMGLNYTLFRFVVPPLSLLLVHIYGSTKPRSFRCLLAGVVTLLNCLISPEIGVTSSLSLAAYFILRKQIYPVLVILLSFGIMAYAPGYYYFLGLLDVGEGAYNFPIFPTVHVILYLAGLAILLPQLAASEWFERGARKGLAGGFFVLAATTVPAALGRCDSGHILYNGVTLFVFALAAIANHPALLVRRLGYGSFICSFILIAIYGFWSHYDHRIILALKGRLTVLKQGDAYPHQDGVIKVEHPLLIFSKPAPLLWSDLNALRKYGPLGTPLTFEMEIDRFLKLSHLYAPAYHANPIEIANRKSVERQIDTIKQMRHILIPEDYSRELHQPINEKEYNAANSRFLRELLFFPVSFKAWRHAPFVGPYESVRYIEEHFEEQEHWRHYIIMTQKTSGSGDISSD